LYLSGEERDLQGAMDDECEVWAVKKKKNRGFLGSKDVAWVLCCGPDGVIELARSGKLQPRKVGRFRKYREADVIASKNPNRESA
jgi:hypothetical protein